MALLLLQGTELLLTLKIQELAEAMDLLRCFLKKNSKALTSHTQFKALTVKVIIFIGCYV